MSKLGEAPDYSNAPHRAKPAIDVLMLMVLALLVWSIVWGSGNITGPPAYVDDVSIYALNRDIDEFGFWATAGNHVVDRFERMGRLLPTYLVAKVAGVKLLGTSMVYWSVAAAVIGILGAALLYLAGRAMRLSAVESLFFSLIVTLGEQSALWWRRLHGEGIGLVFLGFGLVCLARGAAGTRFRAAWDICAALAVVLATLSKESFILAVPALCALRIWLETQHPIGYLRAVKRNALLIAALSIVIVGELVFIVVVRQSTSFFYTGWKGFDAEKLLAIFLQFSGGNRTGFWLIPLLMWLIIWGAGQAFGTSPPATTRQIGGRVGLFLLVVALFVVPQLLLYMSSGFSGSENIDMGRFMIPATLGLAFGTAFALRLARTYFPRLFSPALNASHGGRFYAAFCLAVAVPLVFQGAVAYADAVAYRERLDDLHSILEPVAQATEPGDVILLAYDAQTAFDTMRFGMLLDEYYKRSNLYYVPITWDRNAEAFDVDWYEYDRYALRVDQRTVVDPGELPQARAFIISDASRRGIEAVIQNLDWFEVSMYDSIRTKRGHLAFLRRSSPREKIGPAAFTSVELSLWRLSPDGTMTIRGHALTSEPVKSLTISIGSVVLGSVPMTDDALATARRRVGFEFSVPSNEESFGQPARVAIHGHDREIGSSVFAPRYDLPDEFEGGVRERLIEPYRGTLPDLIYRSEGFEQRDGTLLFRGWALSPESITHITATVGSVELGVQYSIPRPDLAARYLNYLTKNCGYEIRVPQESDLLLKPMTLMVWSGQQLVAAVELDNPRREHMRRIDRE